MLINKFIISSIFFIFLLHCISITTVLAQENKDIQLANEYYAQGEFTKAKELYKVLAKQVKNIPLIHNNYFFILIKTEDFKVAEKYMNRLLKKFPKNIYYELDFGLVYWNKEDNVFADDWFANIIKKTKQNRNKTRIVAQYFVSKQLTDYGIRMFLESREASSKPYLYALELANIYRIINEKELMVEEYLNYIIQYPSNIDYVKNTLQNILSKDEELESLEILLYQKLQEDPDKTIYNELLVWVLLQQQKNYMAFIQAKALDKKLKNEGENSNKIGLIALNNNDFDLAIKIFTYLTKEYPKSINYAQSKMYLIKANENRIKATYPIEKTEIKNLILDYKLFVEELGININSFEALRNKALLHAFYLDEKDTAILILKSIVKIPQANNTIKSKSKMDLGDIYLLQNEPWESVLYYAQVEKSNKETKIGYEAKLKNAKLFYYTGDFTLAQEHLDILKQATTKEIANDAMELSILIKDNIALDTNTQAMKEYAAIDLLLFQNKKNQALDTLQSVKVKYLKHRLIDDILWLEAKINIDVGNFEEAKNLLRQIVFDYPYDIWSDDAYFKLGEVYEKQIGDLEKAKEVYYDFLTKYPGSVYVAEVRKKFRKLRGNFKSTEKLL